MSGGKYVRAPGYKDISEYNDYLIDDMWADESDIEGQEERQDDYSGGDSDDSSGFGGVYDNVEESTAEAADECKPWVPINQCGDLTRCLVRLKTAGILEKVRLCGYSSEDQDRFVRAQLLKGMRNKDLVKTARTFGYETLFVEQSATREEAYTAETAQSDPNQAFAVAQHHVRAPGKSQQRKRKNEEADDRWIDSKRRAMVERRKRGMGRRSRCPKCNRLFHKFGSCPAINVNCNTCGERGHFAIVCRRKIANQLRAERDNSPGWRMDENDEKEINAISLADTLIHCHVGKSKPIRFMIDSGADVNTIGGDDWINLKREFLSGSAMLEPIKMTNDGGICSYASAKPISVKGAFKAVIEVVGHSKPSILAVFYVVDQGSRSLLGRSTASDLRLLKVDLSVNSCEKTFPKVPGVRVKFSVDPSVTPAKNAYYNVPAAYKESARARLSEMENQGIIERVTSAPDWISGMSAVAKGKNDFRLVVNMKAPNRAIKREYYRLPSLDEMRTKLHGAKYFTKRDLSNAFYHLELHEQSRDLTTFLTENGMFRFTRLMFGVICAPEIFQREMSRLLLGEENVIVYIDDILMFADNFDQLRGTVARVLRILRANHLTLNSAKCEFDKKRIRWLGHELDEKGFNIDEDKVKDIRRFRQPNTVSELRSFLGLASFVSPYIRGFADIANLLWALTNSSNADPSSRLYEGVDDPFEDGVSPWELASLEVNRIEFLTEKDIADATVKDKQLTEVIDAVETGVWPKHLKQFQVLGNDLTTREGLLIKTGWAVIPESIRQETLAVAHSGHPSTAKVKNILRERVWWPGMTKDAEAWVTSCGVCATNGRPEWPTPMTRVFAPQTVWETIGIDFNGPYNKFGGVSILVLVDYRSRYVIAKPVRSTSFAHTRKILDEIFEKEGYPQTIKSDNGPPFNGDEYKMYCSERGINATFSTPLYPQQNGLAESCMKLVNKAMSAASASGTPYEDELSAAVQAYNAATHSVTGVPPEEVMTGRKIRRRLPLLCRGKVNFDDNLLNAKDLKSKTEA
ncbi:uncharacterized protein K02A2.6-like [Armigeres subalbatus]|uniref:uncharacterized protein K02A2.6-like n=1 Tax=Armigeres subalbatus TaxID=124917 RepID=UPI002ED4942F